ncbi:MAG: holo-ACP synthase CitX [Peptococcaceae bacterium]|nr:holo-ACP synthase CitX [Peptococcaceae bacterium]
MQSISLEKMLLTRDERWQIKNRLKRQFQNPVVSITLNIPGPVKDSSLYRRIHREGMKAFLSRISCRDKVLYHEVFYKPTGPEGYLCIACSGLELKKIGVELEEEHPLGRVFDIDVLDHTGVSVNRQNVGRQERKCLICSESAWVCMRERNHFLEELLLKIELLAKTYLT